MAESKSEIRLYLPDMIAFILPQVGLITYLFLFLNYEINTIQDVNLVISTFWIFLAIPGLISGFLTRSTKEGFETTFLSGVILSPILAIGGLIIIQGFAISNIIMFIILGVIVGGYTGCFGYIGGWIGKKVTSFTRPSEKKSPFDLLRSLINKIAPRSTSKSE
ncbi:MAG: hypothetical protein JSW11_09500 [Candidatus Heimdallarchaeota archaeon]|nr:MAG: hypothetical protein JSW11_09500 [Candidatus Heimdallarchaeota archaeon]